MSANYLYQILSLLSIITGLIILKADLKNISKAKNISFVISLFLFIVPLYGFIKNILLNNPNRFSGLTGDRIFESGYCAAVILVFIFLYFKYDRPFLKYSELFFIAITFIYLIKLRTLSGYISFSAGLLLLVILHFIIKRSEKKKVIILALLLMALVIISEFFLIDVNTERQSAENFTTQKYYNTSIDSRLIFNSVSLKIFYDHPVTGIGVGKWSSYFPLYYPKHFTDENVDMNIALFAHNDFLQMLAEFGISGIIYFLIFIFAIYLNIKNFTKDNKNILIAAMLLSLFITSMINSVIYNQYNFLMLCILLGITFNHFFKAVKSKYFYSGLLIVIIFFVFFSILIKNYNDKYLDTIRFKSINKYRESLQELNSIPDIYNNDLNGMPVCFYKGIACYELKDYQNAEIYLTDALKQSPYNPVIKENYSAVIFMLGRKDEAIKILQELKSYFPVFFEPQINLLAMYMNSGKINEAIELIAELDNNIKQSEYIKNYKVFLSIKKYLEERYE